MPGKRNRPSQSTRRAFAAAHSGKTFHQVKEQERRKQLQSEQNQQRDR